MKCGSRVLVKGEKTFIMGVLNITPNSFSDGGDFLKIEHALAQCTKFIEEGADIIDIGGVSTAPRASFVSVEEEISRVIPVIKALERLGIDNISVDTTRAEVANRALDAGASWINDQSAGRDPDMAKAICRADGVVIMHGGDGHGVGVDEGENIHYRNVVDQIVQFFSERIASLKLQGVDESKIIVDPGVGFGKGVDATIAIINNMHRFGGAMSMIGLSRKSFIGKVTGIKVAKDRDYASLGGHAAAIMSGANIIRTHNVLATVQMAQVLDCCLSLSSPRRGDPA